MEKKIYIKYIILKGEDVIESRAKRRNVIKKKQITFFILT